MTTCEVCGNDSRPTFNVEMGGETHAFDSFECAIHALAPVCPHCSCRIVGHGFAAGNALYCCEHCAQHMNG